MAAGVSAAAGSATGGSKVAGVIADSAETASLSTVASEVKASFSLIKMIISSRS